MAAHSPQDFKETDMSLNTESKLEFYALSISEGQLWDLRSLATLQLFFFFFLNGIRHRASVFETDKKKIF